MRRKSPAASAASNVIGGGIVQLAVGGGQLVGTISEVGCGDRHHNVPHEVLFPEPSANLGLNITVQQESLIVVPEVGTAFSFYSQIGFCNLFVVSCVDLI